MSTPGRRLAAKDAHSFYWGTRKYPDKALNIICCAGLYTRYTALEIADFFNRGLAGPDVRGAPENEVNDVFFHMKKADNRIYVEWQRLNPGRNLPKIDATCKDLVDNGYRYEACEYKDMEGNTMPIWRDPLQHQ